MPGGNRTGPMGAGAMTGRAAGYCSGSGMPGYANSVPGRGFGMRAGRGRGFGGGGRGCRNMFYTTGLPGWMRTGGEAVPYGYPNFQQRNDPEMERQALRNQATALQSEMDLINKRLSELGTENIAD